MKKSVIILISMLWIGVSASDRLTAQWVRQQVSSDATFLYTVGFVNDSVGCAVGSKAGVWSGRIVRTTNAGASWIPAELPDSSRSIIGLRWVSSTVAYAAGAYNIGGIPDSIPSSMKQPRGYPVPLAYGYRDRLRLLGIDASESYRGYFLKSTDAGQSWFPYGTLPDSVTYIYDIVFPTSTTGYAVADTASTFGGACILKTTDGGSTWQKMITPDSVGTFRRADFVDSLRGVAVGYSFKGQFVHGIIIHTTDGGTTWTGNEFNAVDNFTTVSYSSDMEGYASGISSLPVGGMIYKTTDGGTSWAQLPFPGDTLIACNIRMLWGTNVGIAFGNTVLSELPFVARTPDGGGSWSEGTLDPIPGSPSLIGGTCLDSLNAFICGGSFSDTAIILRTTNGGVTGVKDIGKGLPTSFELKQNYPNPFNPATTISFNLPSRSLVSLKVFDVLGREIVVLVNSELQAGRHSVQWMAADNPSGVYFYRLQCGTLVETRKLLLLK